MWMMLFSLWTAEAMPSTEFTELSDTLEHTSFSDDQIRILKALPQNTFLTIDQSIEVLAEFSFSSDKLEALRVISPYIEERNQQYRIIESFTFSTDKGKASHILDQIPPNRYRQQEAERQQRDQHKNQKLRHTQEHLEAKAQRLREKSVRLESKEQLLNTKTHSLEQREQQIQLREQALKDKELDLQSQQLELREWELRLKEWELRLRNRRDKSSERVAYRDDTYYWGGYDGKRRRNH